MCGRGLLPWQGTYLAMGTQLTAKTAFSGQSCSASRGATHPGGSIHWVLDSHLPGKTSNEATLSVGRGQPDLLGEQEVQLGGEQGPFSFWVLPLEASGHPTAPRM